MDRTSCAETAMVERSENKNIVRFFMWKCLREKMVYKILSMGLKGE